MAGLRGATGFAWGPAARRLGFPCRSYVQCGSGEIPSRGVVMATRQEVAGAARFIPDLDLMLDTIGQRGVVVFAAGYVGSSDSTPGYLPRMSSLHHGNLIYVSFGSWLAAGRADEGWW